MKRYFCALCFMLFFFSFSVSCFANSPVLVPPYFETENYEEYEAFLKSEAFAERFVVAERFVTYQEISFLGEFYKFYVYGDMDIYHYVVIAPSGEKVRLAVSDWGYEPSVTKPLINESKDLRTYWNTVNGTVVINGVRFEYLSGKLYDIRWWNDGICFGFEMSQKQIREYPDVEGDLISMRLMRDSAEEAIDVLFWRKEYTPPKTTNGNTDVSTDGSTDFDAVSALTNSDNTENAIDKSSTFSWGWVALPVGVALIGGGTAFFLIRKKRRKAAVAVLSEGCDF